VKAPKEPMQDAIDRDWQLVIKGEELLDRAHEVARNITKRVRKVWRSDPPQAQPEQHKRSNR
jgi:hypothetical protein